MLLNLCIQHFSHFKQLILYAFIFIICTTNILAQSYEPIGTINPNNFEPAQKKNCSR
jgi:hypothetical protein